METPNVHRSWIDKLLGRKHLCAPLVGNSKPHWVWTGKSYRQVEAIRDSWTETFMCPHHYAETEAKWGASR